jgi:hypothetical protein
VWGIQASVKFFTERGLAAPETLERVVRSITGGFDG